MRITSADISIIIPNYNSLELLSANLPSVVSAAHAYPGVCQVVVVDDASPQTGFEDIASAHQGVRAISREVNGGFAEAIHTGVAASESDLLVFLNSDVAPQPDFLEPLADGFVDESLFSASPLIFNEDGSTSRYAWNRRAFSRGKLRDLDWDPSTITNDSANLSLYSSGGSMMVRRSMFSALGGFASIFAPFYSEDLDLCVRAWRNGWKTVFVPASKVTHQEVGAIRENVKRYRIKSVQRRNSLLFEWIHFSRGRLLGYRTPYYIKQFCGRLLRGDWVYLSGFIQATGQVRQALDQRRKVASSIYTFEEVLDQVNKKPSRSDTPQ